MIFSCHLLVLNISWIHIGGLLGGDVLKLYNGLHQVPKLGSVT